MSRKCVESAAQRVPAFAGALLGRPADQPHEHRHERQGQEHHERGFEVDRRHPSDHRERHHRGEHELRQVAGEVRLERRDALDGGGRDLAGLRPVRRRRLVASRRSASASRSSERTLAAARRPATSIAHASAPRTANASASTISSSRTSARVAPSNARATIRASSVACARTGTTVATPSAVSSASSGRTDRVRRTRRGSRARTASSAPASGRPAGRLAADVPEHVVRPALVEEHQRREDRGDDRDHASARSAPAAAPEIVRLLSNPGARRARADTGR